jgi:hypothetical protein
MTGLVLMGGPTLLPETIGDKIPRREVGLNGTPLIAGRVPRLGRGGRVNIRPG